MRYDPEERTRAKERKVMLICLVAAGIVVAVAAFIILRNRLPDSGADIHDDEAFRRGLYDPGAHEESEYE